MEQYIFPSEWAQQEAVMLTWPHKDTDWKPYLAEITETFLQLAQVITDHENLIVATPWKDEVETMLRERLPEKNMARVDIYDCPSNDTWARDHGPITLLSSNHEYEPQLLDFQFNGWGKKFAADKDNAITRNLYKQGAFKGKLIDNNDFVLEGGSIESDGKGTVMTTSFCLMAPNRNQPLTKDDIEQQLKNRLHASRIIWLDHGQLIGDDTDGHIDTIVRFAPNDTIVYVGCDDKEDPQYEDFKLLEEQLQGLKTEQGKPYRLVKLPMPHPIYDGEDRLPATYANFLIINGAVIVPTYNQPSLDKSALDAVASAFPKREVIGIDGSTIIRQHGSIHCLTMQIPSYAALKNKD